MESERANLVPFPLTGKGQDRGDLQLRICATVHSHFNSPPSRGRESEGREKKAVVGKSFHSNKLRSSPRTQERLAGIGVRARVQRLRPIADLF